MGGGGGGGGGGGRRRGCGAQGDGQQQQQLKTAHCRRFVCIKYNYRHYLMYGFILILCSVCLSSTNGGRVIYTRLLSSLSCDVVAVIGGRRNATGTGSERPRSVEIDDLWRLCPTRPCIGTE